MENKKNNTFLAQHTTFGLFVGLSYILASYLFYKTGRQVILNPQFNNVLMLLTIAGTFIGVRKYREESLGGIISYGNALGSAIYLITIAAVIYGLYINYLYHKVPELQENYVTSINLMLQEVYKGSPLLEPMTAMIEKWMTPGVIALSEMLNKIFTGFIFSLLLAGILRRKQKITI